MQRRIIREDWYWPTIKKIAENRFRKGQTKADLLLEMDLRSRWCCEYFGKDAIACQDCFRMRGNDDERTKQANGTLPPMSRG